MKMIDTGKEPLIETYRWICGDRLCDTIFCYRSKPENQTICNLWSVSKLSDFHDAKLAEATKKINAIFDRLEKANKKAKRDKERKLSFIEFQSRLLLIWAGYGVVGPDDDFKTIKKALSLRS
jgi:hypothetical protein